MVINEMTALAGATNLRNFDRAFARTNELRTGGTTTSSTRPISQSPAAGPQGYTGWSNPRSGDSVKTEADDSTASRRRRCGARWRRSSTSSGQCASERLEGLVLRYGSLYGPGTAFSTDYVEQVRSRRLPVIGSGAGIWSFVHVDDAAAATAIAAERGRGRLQHRR